MDAARAVYAKMISQAQVFVSYAWGDTSPNTSEEDSQRHEVVERLCRTLEKENWQVVRDKNALRYGDPISTFMKTLVAAKQAEFFSTWLARIRAGQTGECRGSYLG